MKSRFNIVSTFIAALIVSSFLGGCNDKNNASKSLDNVPEDAKPLAKAIINDSPQEFAAAMNYPIERPYPLPDVIDSAQMVKYYTTLVDDSLKNVVKLAPDTLWEQDGWRGWTLYNGSYLWIDEKKVYSINYVSSREHQMLDSLRKEEISTLDPSLRHGWTPVLCIIDSIDGVIFRIDSEQNVDSAKLRLAGYERNNPLSDRPTLLLYGKLETEGSMNSRFYHFSDSVGNSAEYAPDALDEDTIPIMEVRHRGKHKKYRVKPGYWLDHIKMKNTKDTVVSNIISDSTPNDLSMTTHVSLEN